MSISYLFYIIGGQYLVAKLWNLVPISGFHDGWAAGSSCSCRCWWAWCRASAAGALVPHLFLEEANQDYVRTARAKGASEIRILFRHILPNAADSDPDRRGGGDPVAVHGRPADRIVLRHSRPRQLHARRDQGQDFAIVRSMVFIGSILYIIGLILTDISYTWADPGCGWTERMKPVLLWSDALIYLLVAVAVPFVLRCFGRDPQTRERWREIFSTAPGHGDGLTVILVPTSASRCWTRCIFAARWSPIDGSPAGEVVRRQGHRADWMSCAAWASASSAPTRRRSRCTLAREAGYEGRRRARVPRFSAAGARGGAPGAGRAPAARDVLSDPLPALAAGCRLRLLRPWCMLVRGAPRVAALRLARRLLRGDPRPGAARWSRPRCLRSRRRRGCVQPHYHVLGTDLGGADVAYQSIKGVRTGVLLGTRPLIMLPIAVTLGVMAGYFKGWVDDVVQYLYTTLSSIPGILLIAASVLSVARCTST